jgi:hypothetical protein
MKEITLSAETAGLLDKHFPGRSDRFFRNLLRLWFDPAQLGSLIYHWAADRSKIPFVRVWLECFDEGILDEKKCEVLIRNLFRKKKLKRGPDIDVAICYLDDTEKLTLLSSTEASKRLSWHLKHQLPAATYRKRIERLRRKGVKLLCM